MDIFIKDVFLTQSIFPGLPTSCWDIAMPEPWTTPMLRRVLPFRWFSGLLFHFLVDWLWWWGPWGQSHVLWAVTESPEVSWRSLETVPLELRVEDGLDSLSDECWRLLTLMRKCAECRQSQLGRASCTGKTPASAQQTPRHFCRTVAQSGQHSALCFHLLERADRSPDPRDLWVLTFSSNCFSFFGRFSLS